jgi:hypothetical protein
MSDWMVSTPIDTFVHKETDSVIDLVSTVHVGLPNYYRKLGNYILARQDEGFVVHYEGITEAADDAPPKFAPIHHLKFRLQKGYLNHVIDGYVLVESHSEYTLQDNDMLFLPITSENNDMTDIEYAGKLGILTHLKAYYDARKLSRKLGKAADEGTEVINECVFNVIKKNVDMSSKPKFQPKWDKKVTLDQRNEIALHAVDRTLEKDPASKLVLLWGIGHRAGLLAGLELRGYSHTEQRDFRVAFSEQTLIRTMRETNEMIERLKKKLQAGQPIHK